MVEGEVCPGRAEIIPQKRMSLQKFGPACSAGRPNRKFFVVQVPGIFKEVEKYKKILPDQHFFC
jgi:hypothetical protein